MTDGGDEEERGKGWSCELEWHTYILAYTHTHTHTLVYINRYSVKTGGTVTLGSYKVHLSVGTKCDQWQVCFYRYLLQVFVLLPGFFFFKQCENIFAVFFCFFENTCLQ